MVSVCAERCARLCQMLRDGVESWKLVLNDGLLCVYASRTDSVDSSKTARSYSSHQTDVYINCEGEITTQRGIDQQENNSREHTQREIYQRGGKAHGELHCMAPSVRLPCAQGQ